MSKWLARYRQGGTETLEDRSSAPLGSPTRTSAKTVDLIEHWRRAHKWSARRISHELAARGTVVSVRRDPLAGQSRSEPTARHRSHRTGQLDQQTHPGPLPGPHDPPGRQEGRTHPTRKEAGGPTGAPTPEAKASERGKGARIGYTYLHTAIDGFSRLAYTEALDDERASTTIGLFCRARALVRRPRRHQARASRHRQRGQLPRPDPHHDHHLPGLTPPEDPPPHPTSQRQGRALQPHPGRGAPLRAQLLLKAAAPRRRRGVEPPLQLPSTPHRLPQPATRHPRPNTRHQRHDLIHLVICLTDLSLGGGWRAADHRPRRGLLYASGVVSRIR